MKRVFTLALIIVLALFSTVSANAETIETVPAFTENIEHNSDQQNPTRNTDLITFADPSILDGGIEYTGITPGSGRNMKIHVYMYSGSLTVWVKHSSSSNWTSIATWNTSGHHWADLVCPTSSGSYNIRLWGSAAIFKGGVYLEP